SQSHSGYHQARGTRQSAGWAMEDAYRNPEKAKEIYDGLVAEHGEAAAVKTVTDKPSVLGRPKGIGLFGLKKVAGISVENMGTETYRDAMKAQGRMLERMSETVQLQTQHETAEADLETATKTRKVEEHLIHFTGVPQDYTSAMSGYNVTSLEKDIEAHRKFETALATDPAAAHAQAAALADRADPGGRWRHLLKKAEGAMGDSGAPAMPAPAPDRQPPAPGTRL
ncbi:MAG: hypothetical protein AAF213_08640, partial [Pseudomonadota bacterium]